MRSRLYCRFSGRESVESGKVSPVPVIEEGSTGTTWGRGPLQSTTVPPGLGPGSGVTKERDSVVVQGDRGTSGTQPARLHPYDGTRVLSHALIHSGLGDSL